MSSLAPYNVSLASVSPFFIYSPTRDGDASITWNSSYTDSPVWPPIANQQEPKGIPYRRTMSDSATMDFSYLGTDVHLCLTDGGASYALTVDGSSVETAVSQEHTACADYPTGTVLLSSSGVRMGNHQVHLKVTASSAKEFRFFGAVVTMGVTSGSSHVLEKLVDDQDAAWTMKPGRGGADAWQSGSDPESSHLINDGHSWTCIYDSVNTQSASYTFTGAGGVLLRGTVGMGLEVYSVDFDGEHTDMDATSVWPDPSSVVLFMRGGLDPKRQYTITLNNFNENYPTCDKLYYLPPSQHLLACCVNLDGLVLLGDGSGTAVPLPQPSSSHIGSAPQSPPTSTADAPAVTSALPLTNPELPDGSVTSSASALTATSPPGHRRSVGAIAGASVGGVFGAIMILLVAFACLKLWQKRLSASAARETRAFSYTPSVDMIQSRRDSASMGIRHPSQARGNKLYALASSASIPKPETSGATATEVSSSAPFGTESMNPSEARSVTTSSSRQRQRHMPPEVLEEVLAFVAERMDGETLSVRQGRETSALPPRYRW